MTPVLAPLRSFRERIGANPDRLRVAALIAAVVVAGWSLLTAALVEPYTSAPDIALTTGALVLGWLAAWRRHPWIFMAFLAAMLAYCTPVAMFLWPAVAAAVFISYLTDPAPRPWWGLVAGFVGSVASIPDGGFVTVAPYLATILGASLAAFLRALLRSGELVREARVLRNRTASVVQQARWLEQRTVLARELHDVVGHHVTAMVVQAEAGLVSDPGRSLQAIAELGRSALGELDALVVHLRDPDAPLALSAPPRLSDIEELLAAPLRQQGVEVQVRIEPDLVLDDVLTLTTYRIAQETLTNIARHARAATAWVELDALSGRLRLRVTDDGVGPPAEISRGAGLLGIEERVRAAGGLWAMTERPGGGTVVDVFLPLALAESGGAG